MDKYRDLFISEAREYLQNINNSLLLLEKNPEDISSIEDIFRSMHTLKGMAASMGYNAIVSITHASEDFFGKVKNGDIVINTDIITNMFTILDYLEILLDDEEKSKGEMDKEIEKLIEKIKNVKSTQKDFLHKETNISDDNVKGNDSNTLIKISINKDTPLKSVRSFIIIKALEDKFDILDIVPNKDAIMKEEFDNTFIVMIRGKKKKDEIEEVLFGMPDLEKWEILKKEKTQKKQKKKRKVKEEKTQIDTSDDSRIKAGLRHRSEIKVPLKRLDYFQNLIAELVISKGALTRISNTIQNEDLHRIVSDISTLVGSLQDEVVNMRMVPVSDVFDRYPRYVRDISVKLNKKINFEIKGRDIELDRSVLDKIAEPLLHLLRNSVDHGIESPEERRKKGKNEEGTIVLEAKREKSNVVIEVFDNGRGLDPEQLIKIALKKGIITEEEATNMSHREAIYLIAKNGFSTKDGVTDISGRGVGVDAVRNVLSSVGGRLEIDTKTGEWTRFKLIVPLTLAIIKAMYVKIGDEVMALPLNYIMETMDTITSRIYTIMGKEMVVIRKKIYPVYRLNRIYGISEEEEGTGIIVQIAGKEALITVKEFLYQQEIVVKPLAGMLQDTVFYAGVTIMGNGDPALIIDVSSILI